MQPTEYKMITTRQLFIQLIPLLMLICFCNNGDWDYYNEGLCTLEIGDLTLVVSGVVIDSLAPQAIVDEMEIDVKIIHDEPSNLNIRMIHDDDTISIWENDFPGGTQVKSVDSFINTPANGYWALMVYDEVEDGNEGCLYQFSLGFNYHIR